MSDRELNTTGLDIRASIRLLDAYSTDQLPSPSSVARRLLVLSNSDTAPTREIAQVVKADPALCGRLLKLANSPLVGFSRPIAVIDDAIIILGIQAVHKLAIGMSVLDKSRQGRCPEFDYERFWRHCVLRAVAAQLLAGRIRSFNPGEAFSVALLADIGKLALATIHPTIYASTLKAYSLIAAADRDDPSVLLALEHEHFATDHCELSRALLMDWGLTEVHLLGLQLYYHPEEALQQSRAAHLAGLIRSAELTAAHLDSGAPDEALAEGLSPLLPPDCTLIQELPTYLEQVRSNAAQWDSILGLATTRASTVNAPAATNPASHRPEPAQGTSAAAAETQDLQTPRSNILIADDDPILRSVVTSLLAAQGYHFLEVDNGAQALASCLKDNPDIVILDWEMPDMSGIEVCRALRKSRNGSLYYVIVLTAHGDEAHLVEAFAAGADDFIKKPVTPAELRARVAAASRLVQLRREVERERTDSREHVAELTTVARRMRDAALTDYLTQIPNRRGILDILKTTWGASERTGSALSCLLLDIDHFKQINDVHGHDIGDLVLQRTAQVIRDNLRSGDSIGRIGGEEFLVVAPLTDRDAAMQLCERLRTAVLQHDLSDIAPIERLTVSVGTATRRPGIRTPYELVTCADNGLFDAKQNGRNQCRLGHQTRGNPDV